MCVASSQDIPLSTLTYLKSQLMLLQSHHKVWTNIPGGSETYSVQLHMPRCGVARGQEPPAVNLSHLLIPGAQIYNKELLVNIWCCDSPLTLRRKARPYQECPCHICHSSLLLVSLLPVCQRNTGTKRSADGPPCPEYGSGTSRCCCSLQAHI